ncbi:Hsp70 family protein [Nakamurella sp. A5-74]|uniref:Hsp70 family protein n=1 Tax=Nakamurella sp. A5-74 TaxID=3158264 RepID=A0AAU8DJY8_9ACTN
MTGPGQVMLGIDFGTSNTVAAIAQPNRAPRVLSIDGAGWMPSAVFLDEAGQLVVGRDAERRARLSPERFEPNPKRRVDDGEVMLGDTVMPVVAVIAAVLRRVGEEARRQNAGRTADVVILTHPADWGSVRRNILQSAARQADLGPELTLIPEPVAAAVHFAGWQHAAPRSPQGTALAVYDLGGGTVDCAVVTVQDGIHRVAAAEGLADVGGVDFDQALLDQLGRSASAADPMRWRALLVPRTPADRRAARALHEDVRTAKESLSRYPQTEVPLPPPLADALLSRTEFEGLIRPMVVRTVEVLARTIERSGFRAQDLSGIYLVGGSSRIPLVGQQIAERIGVVPTTLDQPETAVAVGAAGWPEVHRRHAPPTAANGPMSGASAGGPIAAGQTPFTPPARPPVAPGGSQGPFGPASGVPPRSSTDSGWAARPGLPPARRRSRLPMLLTAAAVVLALAATALIIVLTNRSTGAAQGGPSTGQVGSSTGSAGSVSSGPSSGNQSSGSSSGVVDPATCSADKDDRGLTACLRSFGGGLLTDAVCTTDPKKLDVTEEDVNNFGVLSIAWSACFSSDEKYLSLLFHTTNATARDTLWSALGPASFTPKTCGTYLGGTSRGWYMAGPSKSDEVPTILWEDTGLPLIGLVRPPGETSAVTLDALVGDFTARTGFSVDVQDCSKIAPEADGTAGSTASQSTSQASSASAISGSGCPATPLDDNHMSPCVRAVSGAAVANKSLCFTSGDQLEQLEAAGAGQTVSSAACSFSPDGLVLVAVYLQFKDVSGRDAVFESLAAGDTRSDWSQGGRTGESAAGMIDDDTSRLIWTLGDTPVLVMSTAEVQQGGSPGQGSTVGALQTAHEAYWKSVLLPQG